MTKICGYNCEHNKGGICQITYCDKIGKMATTTQWLSGGRQQGKTYQLIKDQQKEIERLTAESTEWESKCYKYQDIINELEKWLKNEHENGYEVYYIMAIQDILDKLKELRNKNAK